MKNPFLNTEYYTVVQEHKKLQEKKKAREASSLSVSRTRSAYGEQIRNQYFTYEKEIIREPLWQRGYEFTGWRAERYESELSRAKYFGVDELRYKPEYFDYVHVMENKETEIQNEIRPRSSSSKYYKASKENHLENKIDEVDEVTDSMTKSNIYESDIRKESVLEEMINLNFSQKNKSGSSSNDFYSSFADLKSTKSKRDSAMSSSIHESEQIIKRSQRFSSKLENSNEKYDNRRRSQYCDEIRSRKSTFESIKRVKEENLESSHSLAPQSIKIRGKYYFRYEKNDI